MRVASFENMDIEFAINNPHYLSGFTITAVYSRILRGNENMARCAAPVRGHSSAAAAAACPTCHIAVVIASGYGVMMVIRPTPRQAQRWRKSWKPVAEDPATARSPLVKIGFFRFLATAQVPIPPPIRQACWKQHVAEARICVMLFPFVAWD